MPKPFHLKFAVTGEARGEIAARIVLDFYDRLRGTPNRISLIFGSSDSDLGGTGVPVMVGRKKYDLGFANPASLARMALIGRGFYREKIPLRAIGVFPSWDRLVFAVRRDSGIESLEDIKAGKIPLRVSSREGGKLHSTLFAVGEVLKGYGFSLADIEKWGGKVFRAGSPSSKERKEQLERGELDAVFDEGVKSWGALALRSGMRFLPLSEPVLKGMEKLGYSGAVLAPEHYPELDREIPCVDFSGWLLFCHRDLPAGLAYELARKIDEDHERIPVDHADGRAMTPEEFCRGGEAGPLVVPLHPGARRYYRERKYL
jgi:TRAP-type uncharacterized transport system substrate-binding protein